MVTTRTRPAEAVETAGPAPWEMLTICLPEELELTDGLLEELSDLNPHWKIERGHYGELVLTMASGGPSAVIEGEICGELWAWLKAGGGGLVLGASAGYNVIDPQGGAPMRNPDVSWISGAQLEPTGGAPPREGFWSLCPAFVVEVRSPSDTVAAQRRRMADWIRFGAQLGWLVDPQGRAVWVYRRGQEPERLERPARLTGESVMEGFAFDVDPIWTMLDRADEVAAATEAQAEPRPGT